MQSSLSDHIDVKALSLSPILPLLGVDISSTTDPRPTTTVPMPISRQDTRQIILIHQIPLLFPLFLLVMSGEFLLIFCENQLVAPVSLAAALNTSIGTAMYGLGDAEAIAARVPLHVFLEVEFEFAVGRGGAGDAGEGGTAAARAELLAHFFCRAEAGVAAEDICLQVLDALHGG